MEPTAEHCSCTGWCITYPVQRGEHHHRDCKRWRRQHDADVFQTRSELIVCGTPDEGDEGHNCDAMGCTSVSHVLFRFPLPAGVTGTDKCETCGGARGGVPGNENRVDGKLMCDYCHGDLIRTHGVTPSDPT